MKIVLVLVSFFFAVNAYADKIITITLSDEQYKAMTVLKETPEDWAQHAVESKANKTIDSLVDKYSDKQVNKISNSEKKSIINSIDLEKEKKERHGTSA